MSDEHEVLIFTGGVRTNEEFELLDEARKSSLPVRRIKDNLHDFMNALADILPTVQSAGGGYALESASVAVGINGKGQVGFLGIGGELGGTATLTLTFARAKSAEDRPRSEERVARAPEAELNAQAALEEPSRSHSRSPVVD